MERTRVRTNLARWLPAAIIPALIAGVALVAPLQASATQDLPAKNPQQVLAMVAGTQVHAFSGTMEQSSELGLPELPAGEKFQNSPMPRPRLSSSLNCLAARTPLGSTWTGRPRRGFR